MKKYLTFLLALGTATHAEIQVQDHWVRATTGPHTAAYMKLINTSAEDVYLTQAYSPASESVELHETTDKGAGMHMEKIHAIHISANGNSPLAPGKTHIMLMNINNGALKEGEVVPLTLEFSNGEKLQLMAPVKAQ